MRTQEFADFPFGARHQRWFACDGLDDTPRKRGPQPFEVVAEVARVVFTARVAIEKQLAKFFLSELLGSWLHDTRLALRRSLDFAIRTQQELGNHLGKGWAGETVIRHALGGGLELLPIFVGILFGFLRFFGLLFKFGSADLWSVGHGFDAEPARPANISVVTAIVGMPTKHVPKLRPVEFSFLSFFFGAGREYSCSQEPRSGCAALLMWFFFEWPFA